MFCSASPANDKNVQSLTEQEVSTGPKVWSVRFSKWVAAGDMDELAAS